MKSLTFEKMEALQGGMGYCEQLRWWMNNNYQGYQGATGWVNHWWEKYCLKPGPQCP